VTPRTAAASRLRLPLMPEDGVRTLLAIPSRWPFACTALPLIARGLEKHMDMGMWFIGMQSHHIAMLKPKLLPWRNSAPLPGPSQAGSLQAWKI